MHRYIAGLALSLLLLSGHASAKERSAEPQQLAARVHDALDPHCTAIGSDDITAGDLGRERLTALRDELTLALEESRKVYLVYWRGVLRQCLEDRERALADFERFLAARAGSMLWASLVDDAQKRVRRLRRDLGLKTPLSPAPGGLAVALGLGVTAGSLGGLSGWQWSVSQEQAQSLYDGDHLGQGAAAYESAGSRAAEVSVGLAAASIGTGLGSVVAAVVLATTGEPAAVSVAAIPRDVGVALAVGGRW